MQLIEAQKDSTSRGAVSAVVLCPNSLPFPIATIKSIRAQTYRPIQIVAVCFGSPHTPSQTADRDADVFVDLGDVSSAAALNAGFAAAAGAFVAALHGGDLLSARYVSECMEALQNNPSAAFAYTNSRGEPRLQPFNFYEMLCGSPVPLTAILRKEDWAEIGGYPDSDSLSFEPREFWLRLAAKGRSGHRIDKNLFTAAHNPTSHAVAALVTSLRDRLPELYTHETISKIKAHWSPAVSIIGDQFTPQSIDDCESIPLSSPDVLRKSSRAPALLLPRGVPLDPHSAEYAALAVWSGRDHVDLPDGSLAVSRRSLSGLHDLLRRKRTRVKRASEIGDAPQPLRTLQKHLANAELLSAEAWLKHPLRSFTRLIPLRVKEFVNRAAGQSIFDLRFYLQFQPNVLITNHGAIDPLHYLPKPPTRRRVALITPHLGSGGAETVLLDIARSLDKQQYEISLIATHSHDNRWHERWSKTADHIYDLLHLVTPERVPLAILTILRNWRHEFLLVQNSLPAYSILPELKAVLPDLTIMDLVHSVDDSWDMNARTRDVSHLIDTRIVISEVARAALRKLGVDENRIRLVRNGIDLSRFQSNGGVTPGPHRILYAARLDPVKRPQMLVRIAQVLRDKRQKEDFRFVIAGDGVEMKALQRTAERAGVASLFDFLGQVPDLAPVLAGVAMLVVTSENEGLPLVVLEAMAAGKPVVASNVGAIHEVLDNGSNGFLVDKNAHEVETFAVSIARLLDDPELRGRMGHAGREKVAAEYDRRRSCAAYSLLFR